MTKNMSSGKKRTVKNPADSLQQKKHKKDPKEKRDVTVLTETNDDPSSLKVGSSISCKVKKININGYVMKTGLKSIQAFLKKKNVAENKEYSVGDKVPCFIKKVTVTDSGNILFLATEKKKTKKPSKEKKTEKNSDLKMPECGFFFTPPSPPKEPSSSDEEDQPDEKSKKKKKLSAAERREQEREKERAIREREEFLASGSMPTSADQFDRLVLSRPDSSMVWIQYMTFHLQMAEIDKARTVAKRAVNTINFREEDERLNVWKAWLNLESKYGTVEETLKNVFLEAVNMNDAAQIYLHMLAVHVDAGRIGELESTIRAICGKNGKFKQDPEFWVKCGEAYLKLNLKEKSRMLMQRALQSLPPEQHVNLLVKFAYLENKFGDKERFQTLFEQVLSSYPKRTDIWISYVDATVKNENVDMARQILQRAINQSIPPKKMKSIFKKYLAFETQYGDSKSVEEVRSLAASYVEKQCS